MKEETILESLPATGMLIPKRKNGKSSNFAYREEDSPPSQLPCDGVPPIMYIVSGNPEGVREFVKKCGGPEVGTIGELYQETRKIIRRDKDKFKDLAQYHPDRELIQQYCTCSFCGSGYTVASPEGKPPVTEVPGPVIRTPEPTPSIQKASTDFTAIIFILIVIALAFYIGGRQS